MTSKTVYSNDLICLASDVRVFTPSWKAALTKSNHCFALARYKIKNSFLIIGESGTGKTALLEHVKGLFPESITPEGRVRPLLYVEIPNKPTAISLLEAILDAADQPNPHQGTYKKKMDRVVKMLKNEKTLLLVLDDLHHFVDKNQDIVLYEASECLKEILIRSKSSVIAGGLEDAKKVVSSNEQLKRRFMRHLELPRYDWNNEDSKKIFIEILRHFHFHIEKHFDLPKIHEETMALRFYLASGGIIDFVVKILTCALCLCISKKRKVITLSDLRRARNEALWDDGALGANPFNEPFDSAENIRQRLAQASQINQKVLRPVSKRRGSAKSNLSAVGL